ncbi:MAG: rhodanese-like domain-containing protein [Magnetococcus sp. DMHC-6]
MIWLQENISLVLFIIVFLILSLRVPILARLLKVEQITTHELNRQLGSTNPPVLMDVRTPGEFNSGHIDKAVSIPLSELHLRLTGLIQQYPNREIAVICRTGNRSLTASISLKRAGFPHVFNVIGGLMHWQSQGYPVRK